MRKIINGVKLCNVQNYAAFIFWPWVSNQFNFLQKKTSSKVVPILKFSAKQLFPKNETLLEV